MKKGMTINEKKVSFLVWLQAGSMVSAVINQQITFFAGYFGYLAWGLFLMSMMGLLIFVFDYFLGDAAR